MLHSPWLMINVYINCLRRICVCCNPHQLSQIYLLAEFHIIFNETLDMYIYKHNTQNWAAAFITAALRLFPPPCEWMAGLGVAETESSCWIIFNLMILVYILIICIFRWWTFLFLYLTVLFLFLHQTQESSLDCCVILLLSLFILFFFSFSFLSFFFHHYHHHHCFSVSAPVH